MGKRNKYDYEFRLKCVEAVVKKHHSIGAVAREHGLRRSNLQLWLEFYEFYGKAGLKPFANRHYDLSFKLNVLKAIDMERLSLREACVRFIIPSDSVIVKWKQEYSLNGLSGLTIKARGRPPGENMLPIKRKPRKSAKPLTREQELLLNIEALEAENELLKKLQALAQANKKQKP